MTKYLKFLSQTLSYTHWYLLSFLFLLIYTGIGNENSFAPSLKSNEEATEIIPKAIHKAGYIPGNEISLGDTICFAGLNTFKYE